MTNERIDWTKDKFSIRLTKANLARLKDLHDRFRFSTRNQSVNYLIETHHVIEQDRQNEIQEIRERMERRGIRKDDL